MKPRNGPTTGGNATGYDGRILGEVERSIPPIDMTATLSPVLPALRTGLAHRPPPLRPGS